MKNKKVLFRNTIERMVVVFFGMAPLFLVTVRSWINAILILGSFACIFLLIKSKSEVESTQNNCQRWIQLVCLTLTAPMLAIMFSSLMRSKFTWADFDSPARFLLSTMIFLFAIRKRINILYILQYAAPASLLITCAHQLLFPQPRLWGADRMSTYFADPLVFGYTSLTLGLISLVSINLVNRDSKSVITFKLIGLGTGLYLSIMSGSRTGWVAAPIIIAIWLYQKFGRSDKRTYFIALIITITLFFGLFNFSSIVSQRLGTAFSEIINYPWTGLAPETSVGLRITFLRIAFDMFMSNPIVGFGDTRLELAPLPAHIYTYATPESLRMAFISGFHNEIVTNAIRSGLGGLVASVMLFFVPIYIYFKKLNSVDQIQRGNALIGLIFTICVLISSFSTEVFDLKYTASFYALMTALLCASSIASHDKYFHSDQEYALGCPENNISSI